MNAKRSRRGWRHGVALEAGVWRAATGSMAMLAAASLLGPAGCTSPLDRSAIDELQQEMLAAHRARLERAGGEPRVTVSRAPSDVEKELTDERRARLDEISGIEAYRLDRLDLGEGLTGREQAESGDPAGDRPGLISMSLSDAVRIAVENNIDLRVAQVNPAIAEQQIIEAQAAFDVVSFADVNWDNLDQPGPSSGVPGVGGDRQQSTLDIGAGLRKRFSPGTTAQISANLRRNRLDTLGFDGTYWESALGLSISQPLLEGFGTEVNEAQITLAYNARASEAQNFRQTLLELVAAVESAYWELVTSRQVVLIQNRLLERTVEDRDRLVKRADFDVSPVRVTEANSFVELRRSDVIRARQNLRDASDRLKRLINDPQIPLSDESLIVPTEMPMEQPVSFSLLDAVTTALRHRPEMQRSLLSIADAATRLHVAENALLPLLDLTVSLGVNGLDDDDAGGAISELTDLDYIDYAIGVSFEQALGNREAEAAFEAARLSRQGNVFAYQRQAQDVILEVKQALRNLRTSYELIGATRASRRAAADSLRAIEEQEAAGVALTPEFLLDLKLQTQERLANTETQEIQAMADYNNAIAEVYRSMGTLLRERGIDFEAELPMATE